MPLEFEPPVSLANEGDLTAVIESDRPEERIMFSVTAALRSRFSLERDRDRVRAGADE